jgi:hypothetical protein
MILIDLVNEVQSAGALGPATVTASTQGNSFDFSNCKEPLGMIVDVGAITVANVTSMVVQCEESTNGISNWTAITNPPAGIMAVTVTATTTPGNLHQVARGMRRYQYVRANAITVSGTTPGFPLNVEIIGQKEYVVQASGADLFPSS